MKAVFDCNVINIFVNIYFLHRYSGVVDLCLAIFRGSLGWQWVGVSGVSLVVHLSLHL